MGYRDSLLARIRSSPVEYVIISVQLFDKPYLY